jgi:hypothetical protein
VIYDNDIVVLSDSLLIESTGLTFTPCCRRTISVMYGFVAGVAFCFLLTETILCFASETKQPNYTKQTIKEVSR